MPWLMERQLDDAAGRLLQKALEDRGLKFLHRRQTRRIAGRTRTAASRRCASRTAREVPADLVVMAVGIRPNTDLAERLRPALRRAASSSTTPCRPSPTRASMRWASARRTAASPTAWWRRCSNRARSAPRTWRSSASAATPAARPATKLKVTGIDLFSAGQFMGGAGTEEIVLSDPARRRLQEAGHPRRQAGRRRDVRRHGRRRLVLRAAARGPQGGRHPRPPDVRRVQYRRRRPPGPEQGAGHGRQ